ncbi:hypothetical protein POM88_047733 [Heracleum sosnowskyi]|uniref:3-beta hydroxysteroid dehydrogenase/isomerase domain-containing protein n=1 Tax=Heracleum sosnowskyi TaxID=360622 RepID=A0AAD8GUC6_9APIA|nr:hypothetical protein POM88_047733 [Heracleum sosnowskyi]
MLLSRISMMKKKQSISSTMTPLLKLFPEFLNLTNKRCGTTPSPRFSCNVDRVDDPEKELLEPAIKGTKNVLMAAKELGVRRVVITSSMLAIIPSPYWPADVVKNEDCWTDVESCKQKELWYSASKTLAEKAAWEFAKEKVILRLLQGSTETYEDLFIGSFPSLPKDTNPVLLRSTDASKKLMDFGLQFTLIEQIIKDSVESLKSKVYSCPEKEKRLKNTNKYEDKCYDRTKLKHQCLS